MKCGRSNKNGIMIYDSQSNQAIYGYYNQDEICFKIGTKDELDDNFKEYKNKKVLHILMIVSFVIELIISIYSLFHYPFMITFSLILFFISTYIKLLTVIYTFIGKDENRDHHEQFKRFHACEHKLLNINGDVTLEKLKEASMFHMDCGTIHACNIVVFMAIFCFNLAHIFNIGLIRFLIHIIISIIILIINLFNPYNPFFFVQKQVVSKPTLYEYELVLKIAEQLNMTKQEQS